VSERGTELRALVVEQLECMKAVHLNTM
jgi:hypothetical protein